MQVRYENWVGGLNGDWLISRQRFFGVPFPVWYPVGEDGEVDHDHPIVPSEESLPVDPSSDVPPGYGTDQRGRPGGFVGDPDIMDTWATSSLTPQIAGGWRSDPDLFARVFPMDLRPQGQDIIRTWLFSTVVRSHLEHGSLPWSDAAISGWILDPDRKKMSKSKGNVVTPRALLEEHGSDAVRYWAASARLGTDAAFEIGQMKIGRRLAIKVLNASKFALTFGEGSESVVLDPSLVTDPLDRAMLAGLADVVDAGDAGARGATTTPGRSSSPRRSSGRSATTTSSWSRTAPTVRVRPRSGRGTASARAALGLALDSLLRLFAPVLPFATEEVWSWWREGSVHRAAWPVATGLREAAADADPALLGSAGAALAALRKVKSEAKVSMRTPVLRAALAVPAGVVGALGTVLGDIRAAGRVTGELALLEGSADDGAAAVREVELGEAEARARA